MKAMISGANKSQGPVSLLDGLSSGQLQRLAPSSYVRRFGDLIVRSAQGKPVLDVACGGARNSILLGYLGATVIGLDIELTRARASLTDIAGSPLEIARDRITLLHLDLIRDPWPFKAAEIGGIVNVHFFHLPLLGSFSDSLAPGATLLIETEPAHGGNYLQLPQAGVPKSAVGRGFRIIDYRERPAGPPGSGAVTAKLVANKVLASYL